MTTLFLTIKFDKKVETRHAKIRVLSRKRRAISSYRGGEDFDIFHKMGPDASLESLCSFKREGVLDNEKQKPNPFNCSCLVAYKSQRMHRCSNPFAGAWWCGKDRTNLHKTTIFWCSWFMCCPRGDQSLTLIYCQMQFSQFFFINFPFL